MPKRQYLIIARYEEAIDDIIGIFALNNRDAEQVHCQHVTYDENTILISARES